MPIPTLDFPKVQNPVNMALVAEKSYAAKVRAIFGSNLIDYRPLNEGSGVSAFDSSPKAHAAGTITGPTWTAGAGPDGGYALLFDGVNDFVDIYSAGLNTDFNGQLFSVALWWRVANAGVWTDATDRRMFGLQVDSNNQAAIRRFTTNNQLNMFYVAGATNKQFSFAPATNDTTWHLATLTITKAGDAGIGYIDSTVVGSTLTGLGTWAGVLGATFNVIGASNNSGAASWSGYLRDFIIVNRAITPAEVAQLAVR